MHLVQNVLPRKGKLLVCTGPTIVTLVSGALSLNISQKNPFGKTGLCQLPQESSIQQRGEINED